MFPQAGSTLPWNISGGLISKGPVDEKPHIEEEPMNN
jgi:hypothetical protein